MQDRPIWGTDVPELSKTQLRNKLSETLSGVATSNVEWSIANNTGKRIVLKDVYNNKTVLQPRKTRLGYAMDDALVLYILNSDYVAKPKKERAMMISKDDLSYRLGNDPDAKVKYVEYTLDKLVSTKAIFIKAINLLVYLEKDTPEEEAAILHPHSDEHMTQVYNDHRKELYDSLEYHTPTITITANLDNEIFDLDELYVEILGTISRIKVTNVGTENVLTMTRYQGSDNLKKNETDMDTITVNLDDILKTRWIAQDIGNNPYAIIVGINGLDICKARDKVSRQYNPIELKKELEVLKSEHKLEIREFTNNTVILKQDHKRTLNRLTDNITTTKQSHGQEIYKLTSDMKEEKRKYNISIEKLKDTIDIIKQDHKVELRELATKCTQLKQEAKDKLKEVVEKNKQWSKDTLGKVIVHAVTIVMNVFKDVFMLKWVM